MSDSARPVAVAVEATRAELLAAGPLIALWAAGSFATVDFSPAVSDVELVAVWGRVPHRRRLRQVHRAVRHQHRAAARVHCLHLELEQLDHRELPHVWWTHEGLHRGRLSAVARRELLAHGVVLAGPRPYEILRAVSWPQTAAEVRADLGGYWARAARARLAWLNADHLDRCLVVLPRVEAVLREERLITKSKAIERLEAVGLPAGFVAEIRARRAGGRVHVSMRGRARRARRARRYMQANLSRLLEQ